MVTSSSTSRPTYHHPMSSTGSLGGEWRQRWKHHPTFDILAPSRRAPTEQRCQSRTLVETSATTDRQGSLTQERSKKQGEIGLRSPKIAGAGMSDTTTLKNRRSALPNRGRAPTDTQPRHRLAHSLTAYTMPTCEEEATFRHAGPPPAGPWPNHVPRGPMHA
jgi:hypothetical protein